MKKCSYPILKTVTVPLKAGMSEIECFSGASDLDYNDIEKKDMHNVNQASMSSNQCKIGISEIYNWNDLFFSISTQEILDQNNFPSTSKRGHKFPVNKEIIQGLQNASEERPELGEGKNELEAVKNKMHQGEAGKVNNPVTLLVSAGFERANGKKISVSEEGHKSVQNILRELQDDLQATDYETELKDIKAQIPNKSMESKFRKPANSSTQIANKTSFQSATRKREFQDCLQEKDCETELKDVKDRMECKFKKMARSSAQLDKTAVFQTANGNNVLISEKGKKLMEGLLNEFHQSESDGDIEDNLLYLKNKIISKEQSMLPQKKTLKTSLTSRKEDGDYYPSCMPADEKKSNTDVGHAALNVPMVILKNRFLSLNPKLNIRNQPQGLSTPKTMSNKLIQTETTTPELGEFAKNAVETSTPCNRKYLGLRRARPSSKK
uniref:Uncharacterized protein n=1 Tax=Glossina pallidipes TaxID=7398 RepID=A0A1A9ZH62_GLOPL